MCALNINEVNLNVINHQESIGEETVAQMPLLTSLKNSVDENNHMSILFNELDNEKQF